MGRGQPPPPLRPPLHPSPSLEPSLSKSALRRRGEHLHMEAICVLLSLVTTPPFLRANEKHIYCKNTTKIHLLCVCVFHRLCEVRRSHSKRPAPLSERREGSCSEHQGRYVFASAGLGVVFRGVLPTGSPVASCTPTPPGRCGGPRHMGLHCVWKSRSFLPSKWVAFDHFPTWFSKWVIPVVLLAYQKYGKVYNDGFLLPGLLFANSQTPIPG